MSDKKEREMAQEIASYNRKKDYYEILGITKTATQPQIKKAYRILAMRFHPDKNSMPGAIEVFKKISNAYTTLTNKQKKQYYDRYGPQQARAAPPPQYRQYANYGQDHQFQQFDDIFRTFFGHNMHHVRRQPRQANYNAHDRRQIQKNNTLFLLLFVVVFVIYNIAPLFKTKETFSFFPSGEYRVRRTTEVFNVEYYVNNNFFQGAKQDRYYVKKIQMRVDRQYLNQLQATCHNNQRTKKKYQQYAYRQRIISLKNKYLQLSKKMDLSPCRTLNQIQRGYSAYLREINYF